MLFKGIEKLACFTTKCTVNYRTQIKKEREKERERERERQICILILLTFEMIFSKPSQAKLPFHTNLVLCISHSQICLAVYFALQAKILFTYKTI